MRCRASPRLISAYEVTASTALTETERKTYLLHVLETYHSYLRLCSIEKIYYNPRRMMYTPVDIEQSGGILVRKTGLTHK